jgi:precorrin-3B C17-methyltransferase
MRISLSPLGTKERRGRATHKGRVTVVGIGPGSIDHMTRKALAEIKMADAIIGFNLYIQQIRGAIPRHTKVYSSGMGHEVERALLALKLASAKKNVVVVSGGDPGVYGMAGPILEAATRLNPDVEVHVVPGVTAATASAASLGAPLMTDFAVISLSDLLTPREKILERVRMAAKGDFVLVLYNPQSRARKDPIRLVQRILMRHRRPTTPVGIVTSLARKGERVVITTLKRMLEQKIDMTTTLIVGNSTTLSFKDVMLTSRGYPRINNLTTVSG